MKRTCGPLYQEQLSLYTGGDSKFIKVFAAGFISGQAEKVYLGACSAAMFRPSAENFEIVSDIVQQVRTQYGLMAYVLIDEIWICKPEYFDRVKSLKTIPVNSPSWHLMRGLLTGVPMNDIDLEFHLRKGYGEPCDLPGQSAVKTEVMPS